jgi:hypothetical protein
MFLLGEKIMPGMEKLEEDLIVPGRIVRSKEKHRKW